MKKLMIVSLLVLALSQMFVSLTANPVENEYNFDVFPNPMEAHSVVSVFFADKIPIEVALIDINNAYVKTIFSGLSSTGQMQIPFDRLDDKGVYIPKGKYWVVLTTDAKYTSTKKLLILK